MTSSPSLSPSGVPYSQFFSSAQALSAVSSEHVSSAIHNLFGGLKRMDEGDSRNTSIVSLRMRAREHMEHLERKYLI